MVNERSSDHTGTEQDISDTSRGFNAVIAWENYSFVTWLSWLRDGSIA